MKFIVGFVLITVIVTAYGTTQSFIIEPKKNNKKESVSKLKERLCDATARCLEQSSHLLSSMGEIQQQSIRYVEKYAQGSKLCADQQQLQDACAQLEEIAADMHKLRAKIERAKPVLTNVTK